MEGESLELEPPAPLQRSNTIVTEIPKTATAWSSTITLLNCAVGAGVLSFPFAYSCTGWLAGIILTVTVALIEGFTLFTLARYAEATKSSNYGELVRNMLGPGWALAMSTVLFLYIWGSSCAYLIILGDCLTPVLQALFGEAWYTQRDIIIVMVSSALILPLCFPRRLSAIAGVSALTLYGLIVVVGVVVFRSLQLQRGRADPWGEAKAFSPTLQFFAALPIAVFGFQCHTNVIAVFQELDAVPTLFFSGAPAPSDVEHSALSTGELERDGFTELPLPQRYKSRRRAKSPKLLGMAWVVLLAIGITCFFYCVVGVFGYLAFPAGIHSNILTNFSPDDKLVQVARGVVGVIQVASYPVMHHPARAAIKDLLSQLTGQAFGGGAFNAIEPVLFFASTLMLALLVHDLGVVFRLVGGTGGGMLIFMIPGLLLMQYAYHKYLLSLQPPLLEPLLSGQAKRPALAREGGEAAAGGAAEGEGGRAGFQDDGAGEEEAERGEGQGGGEGESGSWGEGAQQRQQQQRQVGVPQRPVLAPLDPWHSGLSMGLRPHVYRYWTSKLWWAGLLLVLLSLGLCALTVYTVFWPASSPEA